MSPGHPISPMIGGQRGLTETFSIIYIIIDTNLVGEINMSLNPKDLTAYCGLYCGDCIRFRSMAAVLSIDLLEELDRTRFGEYAKVKSHVNPELEYYDEAVKVLETIVSLQCSRPCRIGGGCPTFSCEIMKCCLEKGLEGCWQCNEFENCDKFDFLKCYHGDNPVRNLRAIRESGPDGWLEHRQSFFAWE